MPARSFLQSYLYEPSRPGAAGPDAYVPIAGRRAPAFLAAQLRQIFVGAMAEVLEPAGLTSQQWGVLVALYKEPGIDQRRLAERRSIDTNSASRIVDELEALGLALRRASANDRRANELHLTAAGKKKHAGLRPGVLAAMDCVLSPLAQAEKRIFLDLLSRIVEANVAYARPGTGRRAPVRSAAQSTPNVPASPKHRNPAGSPARARN